MPPKARRRKRSRRYSLDTEERTGPKLKRDKLGHGENPMDSDKPMEPVCETKMAGATDALNSKLKSLLQGQEKLRDEIKANFDKQSQELATLIDRKLAGLRSEIDGKLTAVYEDICDIQERVRAIEDRGTAAPEAEPSAAANTDEVRLLQQRVGALESEASGRSLTLIVKGLQESINETAHDLLTKCQGLLTQLQIATTITAAKRIGTEDRGQRPRLIFMTLPSLEIVRQIMRNKRKLKDTNEFSNIYIEPDIPRDIRNRQANIRRFVHDNPTLEMRRGRIVDKAEMQPPRPTQTTQNADQPPMQ